MNKLKAFIWDNLGIILIVLAAGIGFYCVAWQFNPGRLWLCDKKTAAETMATAEYAELKTNSQLREEIISELGVGWKDFEIRNGESFWITFSNGKNESIPITESPKMISKVIKIAAEKIKVNKFASAL